MLPAVKPHVGEKMLTERLAKELNCNRYLLSVKERQKVAHIWSDKLGKNLCGIDYMYAYFHAVSGWKLCNKCKQIYNDLRGV